MRLMHCSDTLLVQTQALSKKLEPQPPWPASLMQLRILHLDLLVRLERR